MSVTAGGMLLLTGADGKVTGVDGASGDDQVEPARSRVEPAPHFVSFAGDPLAYATSTSGDGSSTRVTARGPGHG